jgi:hypothetical protein
MDILYYSNYCKHSQKIVQSLVKMNLKDKLSFINIDNRKKDSVNNQIYIHLENGAKVIMPPNVHSVPALMLVSDNYRLIYGDEILTHLHPKMKEHGSSKTPYAGEPMGYYLGTSAGGTNIVSEQYTDYNMTPDELSAKGKGATRKMHNYVSISEDTIFIETPPDNYTPDKVSGEVTLDTLQQKRFDDIDKNNNNQNNNNMIQPGMQSSI